VRPRHLFAVVVSLLVIASVAGCGTDGKYAALKVPKSVKLHTGPTSTVPLHLDEVQLPGVVGTTTTVPVAIGPGPATIVGRVDGPDGAVGGAIVQLERLVGDRVATVRVPTAADGTWNVQHVLGGRYRIRAWLTPTLGMSTGVLTFVDATERTSVTLHLESFNGTTIDAAIAPSPPVVGTRGNLAVRVRSRQVDANGFVLDVPSSGVVVTLTGSGAWTSPSSSSAVTGSDGVARWVVTCLASGSQPISAQLADGTSQPLNLPPCVADTSSSSTSTSTTTTSGPGKGH
jgi:predicted small lipoprotein YifL